MCSEIVLTARGLLRGVPEVPVRAGRHHVVKDEPLVVVRRQGRLPEGHREETVVVCWANGVHRVSHPTLAQQTGAVEIVFEVSVPHAPSHALRRLLLRVRQQDAIHLRPQADELEDGSTGRLVLEFPEDLFVGQREVWMVGRIIAGVKLVGVGEHVGVDVGGGDLVVTYTLMPRLVASSPVMVEAMTWRLSRRQASRSGAPQVSMRWAARTSPNRSTVVRPLLRVQALHRLLPAAKYRSGIGRRQARHSRPAAAQRSQ